MRLEAWKTYDGDSRSFFESYESLSFTRMHRAFLPFLPKRGSSCLDVGAGSGRDAAALARRGFRVTAVEPSHGLRSLAESHHGNVVLRWVDDRLPKLSKVFALGERYRFILVSAVWMHIPPGDRIQSLRTLARLLQARGYIALTLRIGEPCQSRIMYPVSVAELLEIAEQVGLRSVYVSRKTRDSLNRDQVAWKKVVLTRK